MKPVVEALRGAQFALERKFRGPEYLHAYLPVIRWQMDNGLRTVFDQNKGKIAVGAIIGAGHMPVTISPEILQKVGYHGDGNLSPAQIEHIKQLRTNHDGSPKQIRFIDTNENNATQKSAVKEQLRNIYLKAHNDGAKKVLFSVCSVSAGYDVNYIEALGELMQEYGHENFILSIFTPFNMDSVRSYSLTQGLGQEKWVNRFDAVINNEAYKESIFVHEAQLVPYVSGDRKKGAPSHTEAEERGRLINNDPNSVYWDVNEMMVDQALEAVGGDVSKIYGIFAESFMDSISAVGGGPQIMARLEHERRRRGQEAGATIINVTKGLTDTRTVDDIQAEIRTKYDALYGKIYRRQDHNLFVQLALAHRRRYYYRRHSE